MTEIRLQDDEMKKWLNQIALICLSEDFLHLKKELEAHYKDASIKNVQLKAFQDALYAFLAQEDDDVRTVRSQVY
ncbi:MAG TPA: hypothetical protein VFD15_01275 [Clostridia bacterium]|nr:hypothetical protein [Clostridia bacterium]